MGRWVEMIVGISGGRGDGSDWPPPGGKILVGDQEAEQLIAHQMARPAPHPAVKEERAVVPDTSEHATLTSGAGEPGAGPAGYPPAPAPDPPSQPDPPAARAEAEAGNRTPAAARSKPASTSSRPASSSRPGTSGSRAKSGGKPPS